MGARIGRVFRNFNIENRVHREISKEKPRAAPRHTGDPPVPAGSVAGPADDKIATAVHQKNDPLLTLLKSVYVESKDPDPAAEEAPKEVAADGEAERRPLKYSLPGSSYGLVPLTDVPRGKLSITEALKALHSHQQQPQTWTPEKLAQEYSLDTEDTKALLKFFVPFQVHIIPPQTGKAKELKAS